VQAGRGLAAELIESKREDDRPGSH